MDAKLLSPEFPHTIIVSCTDETLPDRLSHAWLLGSCGEDWTWGRVGTDQARFSFRNEQTSSAFQLRASGEARSLSLR
ncbi:hypothetical protein [Methylobacterium nigriterrae]|uniref:hypothetical protein n=1 Tax=Methylobacterium nigriterrae TaxID=3127512 RepID=UPI003013C9E1